MPQLDANLLKLSHNKEFQKHYEAAALLLDKLRHECGVNVAIPDPFTAAASVHSTNQLLRGVRKGAGNVHQQLRFCTDVLIHFCLEFRQLDVSFTLCDPMASGTILSHEQYRLFVYSNTTELVNAIQHCCAEVRYQVCGDA